MKYYETGRLYAFRDAKIGYHSNADLREAYYAWSDAEPGNRLTLWEVYCDIRDGYAIGTNRVIRERLKQQERLFNEPRYVSALK